MTTDTKVQSTNESVTKNGPRAVENRIPGIDLLKVLMSLCVILVHLGFIAPSPIFSEEPFEDHTINWSDLVNLYLLLLAVPLFLTMSLYLFLQKTKNLQPTMRRIGRMFFLAIFWSTLLKVFEYRGWEIIEWFPKSPFWTLAFLVSAGHTIYYFFTSLAFLTFIAYLFQGKSLAVNAIGLFITTLGVAAIPILAKITSQPILLTYWNPIQFLPFVFAAAILKHILDKSDCRFSLIAAGIFLCVAVALAFLDWTVYLNRSNDPAIPAYCRPSLVFLSMTVFLLAVEYFRCPSQILSFLSSRTLSIYCLHPFFLNPASQLVDSQFFQLLLVFGASLAASEILRFFFNRKLLQ